MPDDVVEVPIEEGEKTMPADAFYDFYTQSMLDGRDDRASGARRFQYMLEFGYVEGNDFRSANAARIVQEAGAGQSRTISTLPGPHAGTVTQKPVS